MGQHVFVYSRICIYFQPGKLTNNQISRAIMYQFSFAMDPYSVAAGVIAFIQLADRVFGLWRSYIQAIEDGPHDLCILGIEITSLKDILENLNSSVTNEANSMSWALRRLTYPDGSLVGCYEALEKLEIFISGYITTVARKTYKHLQPNAIFRRLAWPFKKTKAKKLAEEIQQHKATINLAISADIK
jgi:hypothetical protein